MHTAVSYITKCGKNLLLLSTKHHELAVSDTEKKKPVIITDYNHCKVSTTWTMYVPLCFSYTDIYSYCIVLLLFSIFLYLYTQYYIFVNDEEKNIVVFLSQVVGTYMCRRRTCQWPVFLFYNLVYVSTYNSFVLWSVAEPEQNIQTGAVFGGTVGNACDASNVTETVNPPSICLHHGGGSTAEGPKHQKVEVL